MPLLTITTALAGACALTAPGPAGGTGGGGAGTTGAPGVAAAQTAASHRWDRAPGRWDTRVHFRSGAVDPLYRGARPVPSTRVWTTPAGAGPPVLGVVQFSAPPKGSSLHRLGDDGLEVIHYLPSLAFIVRGPAGAIARAAHRPEVRWSGAYLPRDKWVSGAPGTNPGGRYLVALPADVPAEDVSRRVAALGGGARVEAVERLPAERFYLLRAHLPGGSPGAVAAFPEVLRLDPWAPAEAEDERASLILAGNLTGRFDLGPPGYDPRAQFGVDGAGETVAVVDDGVGIPGAGGYYLTAANVIDGPLHGAPAGTARNHGHLAASLIAGALPHPDRRDPRGYSYGLGAAPAAHIVSLRFLNREEPVPDTQMAADIVATPGPNGRRALVANNSWGAGVNDNAYDLRAACFDALARDASGAPGADPVLFVFSAGNRGGGGITLPGVAKNALCVGATENLRPELLFAADDSDALLSSSSRGPAADGRIKPDLVAPGRMVTGGRSGDNPGNGAFIDEFHAYNTGSSFAAPLASAAAALAAEAWRRDHGGEAPPVDMLRALLVHGAVDISGAGPVPNGDEGWGRVNLTRSLVPPAPGLRLANPVVLKEVGDTFSRRGRLADPGQPLRVTLAWTDPPGLGDPALVNDLDLEVTAGGARTWGNRFAGGRSVTGVGPSAVDNLERVHVPAGLPAGTQVSITVRASALNGNGHLGDGDDTDQGFSLVVDNFVPGGPFVELAAATLVGEAGEPANGAVDPGEPVVFEVTLSNSGDAPTGPLSAAFELGRDVVEADSPAAFGELAPGASATVALGFTLAPGVVCGAATGARLTVSEEGGATAPLHFDLPLLAGVETVTTARLESAGAGGIAVPESGPGSPYPSTITVSGLPGELVGLTVDLIGLRHDVVSDLAILLVAPGGGAVDLMANTGGLGAVDDLDLTIDDAAPGPVPPFGPLLPGAYRPTRGGFVDYPPPAPPSGGGERLAGLLPSGPNGDWQLFVADRFEGGAGHLRSWQLNLTTRVVSCSPAPDDPDRDRDGDGISDAFESAHGLDPDDPGDAAADADGDGWSNLSEFIAGTRPGDPADALRILGLGRDAADLTVSIRAVAGHRYRLERTVDPPSPAAGWTTVAAADAGLGGTLVLRAPDVLSPATAPPTAIFFRLVVAPPAQAANPQQDPNPPAANSL